MPSGRPSKYDPSMCEDILPMFAAGMSKTEISANLGVDKTTFYTWCNEHPEFFNAVKRGEQLSEAWWEKQGRINLENKEFNYTGWYMNMKNRHGWKDRQDITTNDEAIKFNIVNA